MSAIVVVLGAHLLWPDWGMTPAPFSVSAPYGQAPTPDLSLTDLWGKKLELATFRGRVVLLNFWATWCGPCRTEIPLFVDLQDKYRDKGLRIIGISLDDDVEAVRPFYARFRMNYRVAVGDAGLAERYGGILGLPVSFVIGCDGRIRARHDGAADVSAIEREIVPLLQETGCAQGNTDK